MQVVLAKIQDRRRARANKILKNSEALINGLETPDPCPRYLGTENDSSNPIWGYFGKSKAEIADDFESSETDGIFSHRLYDLDSNEIFVPVFRVEDWVKIGL